MKQIDVKEQPKLSFLRTVDISVNGMRYRMFRSLVTVMVITVAIAFLMNILCEVILTRSTGRLVGNLLSEKRQAAFWSARIALPGSPEALLREVARDETSNMILAEDQQMGKLSHEEFTAFRQQAQQADAFLSFFEGIDYGRRRMLVANNSNTAIFDYLQNSESVSQFLNDISKLKLRLPASDKLPRFLQTWSKTKETTELIIAGRIQAIAKVNVIMRGKDRLAVLAEAEGPAGEEVMSAGFTAFTGAIRAHVAQQARQQMDIRTIEMTLQQPVMRQHLAARLGGDVLPGDITSRMLWHLLRDRGTAAWYLMKMQDNATPVGQLIPARVVELARIQASAVELDHAASLTVDASDAAKTSSRMIWLVLVSLLVCVVGISNAMLMSVTERFREIATLKCLGALDGFIMSLFVIEAGILGLFGGLLGGLLGSIIGSSRMLAFFGMLMWQGFPLLQWLGALVVSILVGMLLAMLAAIYPSYLAARLAPMEAMRIE